MAMSCKEQQERVEETVLQPVEQWVERQEERCRDEPCNPWILCVNTVVCWLVTVMVKVSLWVEVVVVRWVYRMVCTAVSLILGVLALVIGRTDILLQAITDLWELTLDVIYFVLGQMIFGALSIVDFVQSAVPALRLQPAKRGLTKRERAVLWPIFGESIIYDAVRLVEGSAGILTIFDRAFTMGYTIYLPSYREEILVHECMHVWQFQFGGFIYIGDSAANQLVKIFNPRHEPYDWRPHIDAGKSWYTLKNIEAQAEFISDVYARGHFNFDAPGVPDDTTPGAFFQEDTSLGSNAFILDTVNYTEQANDAWRIIRTS